MREIEIINPPVLDKQKERTTDLHSLLNVLNIIALQIGELDMDFPPFSKGLAPIEQMIHNLADAFRTEDDLAPLVDQLRKTEATILEQLQKMIEDTDNEEAISQLQTAVENFESIYKILNVRLDEFVTRLEDPDLWISIKADTLSQQIYDVFSAIEKNANGRYHIRFNLALKDQEDYYIDLKVETIDPNGEMWMPMRLKDVLRDLLANSRKYTTPGGKVALAVHQDEERIQCLIEDSGCGIPEEELQQVSEFGYRATNVRQYRTMGGGFGLTKAVWLVLSWGGRFFIKSGLDEGSQIRLSIPNKPRVS